jgi:hypothetical protein
MDERDAEEVRELVLELLDERHEAGPTTYELHRAMVEPDGDAFAFVLVVRPEAGAGFVGVRFTELATDAEALGWDVYRRLEAGSFPAGEGPGADGIAWLPAAQFLTSGQ